VHAASVVRLEARSPAGCQGRPRSRYSRSRRRFPPGQRSSAGAWFQRSRSMPAIPPSRSRRSTKLDVVLDGDRVSHRARRRNTSCNPHRAHLEVGHSGGPPFFFFPPSPPPPFLGVRAAASRWPEELDGRVHVVPRGDTMQRPWPGRSSRWDDCKAGHGRGAGTEGSGILDHRVMLAGAQSTRLKRTPARVQDGQADEGRATVVLSTVTVHQESVTSFAGDLHGRRWRSWRRAVPSTTRPSRRPGPALVRQARATGYVTGPPVRPARFPRDRGSLVQAGRISGPAVNPTCMSCSLEFPLRQVLDF